MLIASCPVMSITEESLVVLCLEKKKKKNIFLIILKCNCLVAPGNPIYLQNDINIGMK